MSKGSVVLGPWPSLGDKVSRELPGPFRTAGSDRCVCKDKGVQRSVICGCAEMGPKTLLMSISEERGGE